MTDDKKKELHRLINEYALICEEVGQYSVLDNYRSEYYLVRNQAVVAWDKLNRFIVCL